MVRIFDLIHHVNGTTEPQVQSRFGESKLLSFLFRCHNTGSADLDENGPRVRPPRAL